MHTKCPEESPRKRGWTRLPAASGLPLKRNSGSRENTRVVGADFGRTGKDPRRVHPQRDPDRALGQTARFSHPAGHNELRALRHAEVVVRPCISTSLR